MNESITSTFLKAHRRLGDNQQSAICNDSFITDNYLFIQMYITVEASLVVISTVLNSLIIIVVCACKRLHTVSNVVIVSLAVSDLVTSLGFGITESFIGGRKAVCFISQSLKCSRAFVIATGISSNTGNHLMISGERWLYIARPFLHQWVVTRRSALICLGLIWILSALFGVNWLVSVCGSLPNGRGINFGIIRPIFHFASSFLMISVYIHIICLTRQAVRNINKTRPVDAPNNETQSVNKLRASIKPIWKSIRLLVIVFGTYFIFLTPVICVNIYSYTEGRDLYDTVVGKVLNMIWSLHCCLNFFIYVLQDRAFRRQLNYCLDKIRQRILQRCY